MGNDIGRSRNDIIEKQLRENTVHMIKVAEVKRSMNH